jgi:hypothetical protein
MMAKPKSYPAPKMSKAKLSPASAAKIMSKANTILKGK